MGLPVASIAPRKLLQRPRAQERGQAFAPPPAQYAPAELLPLGCAWGACDLSSLQNIHGWESVLLPERNQFQEASSPPAWEEGWLHQLLGFKEALEVSHLPDTDGYEDEGLQNGPPQHPLVGALAGLPEALLSPLWEGRMEEEPELDRPHLGLLELLGSLPGGWSRAN